MDGPYTRSVFCGRLFESVDLTEETQQAIRRVLEVIDHVRASEDYDLQVAGLDFDDWTAYHKVWVEIQCELMFKNNRWVTAYEVTEVVRKLVRPTRFQREPVI